MSRLSKLGYECNSLLRNNKLNVMFGVTDSRGRLFSDKFELDMEEPMKNKTRMTKGMSPLQIVSSMLPRGRNDNEFDSVTAVVTLK